MYGYVLISLQETDEKEFLDDLSAMERVKEAHLLFGEWDVIAKVQAESPEDLGTWVVDEIRSRKDVKISSTLIVAR